MANTILIAEDEKFYLKILGSLFSAKGFTGHAADNCRDALRALPAGRQPVELGRDQFLLLSLLMDASPGFVSDEQLCRRIKNSRSLGWAYVQPRPRGTC